MAKHTDWTKAELLAKAVELGAEVRPGSTKADLLVVVDEAEQARALATGVPSEASDFGDLPDEVEPAPEPEPHFTDVETEPLAPPPPPPPPNAGRLPPQATRWRLKADLSVVVCGIPIQLRAGRELLSSQYDMDRLRLAGAELEPVAEG